MIGETPASRSTTLVGVRSGSQIAQIFADNKDEWGIFVAIYRSGLCVFFGLFVCVGLCLRGWGDDAAGTVDVETAMRSVLVSALETMASEARGGGWAMAWTADREVVWGEYKVVADDIVVVQPPATPYVGMVYIRAYEVLDDEKYLRVAQWARDALAAIQSKEGGFPHEWDPAKGPGGYGSYDDRVTSGALQFLVALAKAEPDNATTMAVIKKVGDFLLASQYPNGGFPQTYPSGRTDYDRCITFNDGAMANAIRSCLLLYHYLGDERFLAAAKRGGDCIIALQGGEGEEAWAQQYDPETLEPAWARKFEPPGYSANESVGVCDLLVELAFELKDEKYLEPLPKAFAWFDAVEMADGNRARLYEVGTGVPIYGRRDKAEIVYDRAKATDGYSWEGKWYPTRAKALYEAIETEGLASVAARVKGETEGGGKPSAGKLDEALALDEDGHWYDVPSSRYEAILDEKGVAKDRQHIVSTGTFVSHANILLDALAQ